MPFSILHDVILLLTFIADTLALFAFSCVMMTAARVKLQPDN
jgi:hypothetical protein